MTYSEPQFSQKDAQTFMDALSDANEMVIRHGNEVRRQNEQRPAVKKSGSAKKAGN